MASSSASGGELAELKEDLKGLKEQKAAELKKEKGARDHEILVELNKDLDRVQAAITALSSGGGQLVQQVHDEGITPIAQSIKSLSFKQHAWVATVIMYQILSIWALLADSLDWRHHDAAHICLLVIGVINIALATVGVVYVTDILAQRPAGFDIVQILGMLCSQYVMQPALKAVDNGINWLRQLKDYILNIH